MPRPNSFITRRRPAHLALPSALLLLILAAGCQATSPMAFNPLQPAQGAGNATSSPEQNAALSTATPQQSTGGSPGAATGAASAGVQQASPYNAATSGAPESNPIAQTAATQPVANANAGVAYGQPLVSNHTPIAAQVNCSCCSPNATAGANRLGSDGCIPPAAAWYPFGGAGYVINPQEFLCDGGDRPPHARVLVDGEVGGLGLEDTVIRYTDEYGQIHVNPSNSVCVYAPRFAAVRKITGASTEQLALGPEGVNEDQGTVPIQRVNPSLAMVDTVGPARGASARPIDAFRHNEAGIPVDAVDQPTLASNPLAVMQILETIEPEFVTGDDLAGLTEAVLAAETWTLEEGVEVMIEGVKTFEQIRSQSVREVKTYELDGKGRVQIIKVADRQSAKPGDTVNFILRFDNVGDGPVRNVVILDNLTTRLQYVEDSQTCTKGATFSVMPNDGNSLRLRWELTEPLAVGEGGIIRFQCIVR